MLAICASGCLQYCSAQDSLEHKALKERYEFTTWVGKTSTNYTHRITRWEPGFALIGATNLIARAWGRSGQGRMYWFTLLEKPSVRLHLRVHECNSVSDAHEAIMSYFLNCTSLHPLPLWSSHGLDIGDRSYLSRSGEASIIFARNNMFLILGVVQGDYSVTPLAERLDKQLKEYKP